MDQAYNIAGNDGRVRPGGEQVLCNLAEESVEAPAEALRELGPVAIAQWNLFPARFGYPTKTVTIYDVMGADRRYPSRRDFSGVSGGYLSASRNSLGT